MKIEIRENQTYIEGKPVSEKWKFVSNGTWFNEGYECELEADAGPAGGIFRGLRTSSGDPELVTEGIEYEDGELCLWEEFDIYDENDNLISKSKL